MDYGLWILFLNAINMEEICNNSGMVFVYL